MSNLTTTGAAPEVTELSVDDDDRLLRRPAAEDMMRDEFVAET